jgi:zinc protease
VAEVRGPLAKARPRYVCFVARPTECGRTFVARVHRLTRRLDADPYTDCLWGIVTGYDAADALRLARLDEPLVLRKVLSGTTGGKVGPFEAGVVFDEGHAGRMRGKEKGGPWENREGPKDSTRAIVRWFNDERPDCFITSGHATEHDWQIGYSYKDGHLRCKDGQLFGLDTQKQRHPIHSPNPKVHLPVGNCLIGHVPGRDCMVTALIRSAGVVQMFGYTVPTWYGKGGWGIQDIFLGQPGRFTLAEAFFANTQAMLHEIRTRFPDLAGTEIQEYDLRRVGRETGITDRDALGLLWDRDTVAFYGDPAFDARPARGNLAWDQRVTVDGNRVTLALACRCDGTWPRQPVFAFLPHRIDASSAKVEEGEALEPVITDDFVMVPVKGSFAAGDTVRVVFTAERAK